MLIHDDNDGLLEAKAKSPNQGLLTSLFMRLARIIDYELYNTLSLFSGALFPG